MLPGVGDDYAFIPSRYVETGHLLVNGNILVVENKGCIMRPDRGSILEMIKHGLPPIPLTLERNIQCTFTELDKGWMGNDRLSTSTNADMVDLFNFIESSSHRSKKVSFLFNLYTLFEIVNYKFE